MECSVECFVFGWVTKIRLCSPHQWSLLVRGEVITQTGENGAGALFGIQYSPSSGSAKKSVADLTKPVTVFPPVRDFWEQAFELVQMCGNPVTGCRLTAERAMWQ